MYGGPQEAKEKATESLTVIATALDPNVSEQTKQALKNYVERAQKGSGASLPLICKGTQCPFLHVCQPPGTLIYTSNRGEVPIEDLDQNKDLVISYSLRQFSKSNSRREGTKITGTKFNLTKLYYDSKLVTISAGSFYHETTLNHASIVKWNDAAKDKFIVYLMRRGDYFRIGKTKIILEREKSNTASGLVGRAQDQDADKAWILGVYENNAEATLAEEKLSLYFQVPKAQFITHANAKKQKYNGLYKWATNELLEKHFKECSKYSSILIIKQKLMELGLSIDFPFWTKPDRENNKNTQSRGSLTRCFQVVGYNLLSDIMSVGVYNNPIRSCKDEPTWTPIKVSRRSYQGEVYNLQVDIDHTYIGNRILTHNCTLHENKVPLPVGSKCPLELVLVSYWVNKHLKALNIVDIDNPENSFDMDMLYELATQELLRYRCGAYLSKNPEIVENKMVGESFNGTPIFADVMNPVMEAMEKAGRNISKIRDALLATRKAQVTAGQIILDTTERSAQLRERAKQLSKSRLSKDIDDNSIKEADFKIKDEPS